MPRRLGQGNGPARLPAAHRQRAKRTDFGARERRFVVKMEKGKQRNTMQQVLRRSNISSHVAEAVQ